MSNKNPKCPVCHQESKKYGKRKNKLQQIQQYKCNSCGKKFTEQKIKHKTYPAKIILNAVSMYNLGNTLEASAKLINSRFKTSITAKNVQLWAKEFEEQLPFSNLRKEAVNLHNPKNIIFSMKLQHIQPYTFKYHKAKLYLLFHNIKYNNQFHNISQSNASERVANSLTSHYEPLKAYLEKINSKYFPHHIFTYDKSNTSSPNAEIEKSNSNVMNNIMEQRASQLRFRHLEIKKLQKNNFACKLASLAINLASSNKDRHEAIQIFFLINDSTTIATEIPVYLTNWDAGYYRNQRGFIFPLNNYQTPITGHIDILQIRNGLLHILDYKPEADKVQPIEQLTIYALALSRKLNLPLYFFKCAWFDESNYYEFFPLHAVYEKQK